MPQMAPSMWLNILIISSTMIMLTNSMIYFQYTMNLNNKNLSKHNINWKW